MPTSTLFTITFALGVFCVACVEPFEPAEVIDSRRILAITADPLEAEPGETVAYRAVVADVDGSLYDGPVLWAVAAGDALRRLGEFRAAEAPVRLPASESFMWSVPTRAELEDGYGRWEERGMLLTVGASAFESAEIFAGQRIGEEIPGFTLSVVSDRQPEERWRNPELKDLTVETSDGEPLHPGADGAYATRSPRVVLRASSEATSEQLSYHWFSTDHGFESDGQRVQSLESNGTGTTVVYLVLREHHNFHHDDGTRTRVAGIDWKQIRVRFE